MSDKDAYAFESSANKKIALEVGIGRVSLRDALDERGLGRGFWKLTKTMLQNRLHAPPRCHQ